MAVHPRDLRPLNPPHPPVGGDLADDGSPDDRPSTSSAAGGGGARKVKLLCSYGGRIVPRPSDNALRYAGGDTRIISVRRDAPLPEVMRKMAEACGGGGGPVVMRYQLPDEDLDALVSVSTPEDLENMMEEYDKLALAAPPDGPSVKLRVFLFPLNSADPSSDPLDSSHLLQQQQQQFYIDAVNGFDAADPYPGGGISRLPSMASMVSSQNSDAAVLGSEVSPAADEGTSPTCLSPTDAVAQDPSRLDLGGLATPAAVFSDEMGSPPVMGSQILNPPVMGAPPVFIDPQQHAHFVNAQALGMAGLSPAVNVVGVTPHSYVPATHMSMAPPTSLGGSGIQVINSSVAPPSSQIGSGIPDMDTAMAPLSSQVSSGMPAMQVSLEQDRYGAQVMQLSGDPVYKVVAQPVSQPPPFSPSFLYPQNGERNELRRVPKPSQGQQMMREDCNLCQKVLPHAHSDTLVNEHDNGPRTAIPQAGPVLQSHRSEDILKMWAPQNIVTGTLLESVAEPQSESTVALGHSGNFGFTLAPEMSHDNEKIVVPNGKNLDPAKAFMPLDSVALSGNTQTSYGIFSHPSHSRPEDFMLQPQQQLPQAPAPTQYPIKQDVMSKPFVTDVSSRGNANLYEAGQLIQDNASALSFDSVKPVDGMTKALHVSPYETSGSNAAFVAESSQSARPQIGSNAVLSTYAYINSGIVPEGNTALPVDLLPSNSGIVTSLSSVRCDNTSGMPNMAGSHGPQRFYVETGAGPAVPNDITISLIANAKIPSSTTTNHTRIVAQMQEPGPSDSLFYNEDPRKITGNTQLLPPRPSRVPSKESIKDFSKEKLSMNGKGSDIAIQVEEGDFNIQHDHLNKDLGIETHRPMKGDECVKRDVGALAEGVVASVIQSSEPPIPALLACDRKDSDPCSKDIGTTETNLDTDGEKIEVMKTKQSEKMNFGLPLAEDIGRLQIIKNCDLEELQELGSGTFGTVYHGKWRGSDVAIKRINDRCFAGKSSEKERMRADFWNEACKLADLHHPNVVAFYGVVLDGPGGSIATVTEYMVNGSLRNCLQKSDKKPLDRRKRLLIAMDVAFGMEYLHNRNIVHFDLKSDNLLVNLRDPQRPICKVGDLGLSKVKRQTLISGGVRGTLPWMAPELLNGSSSLVSEKVDVFSFGIVMWELLTKEEPYADLHYGAIIGGIVSNTLRPSVPEYCDPEWKSLMEQCWASEPSERPSFTEIAYRLRAMAAALAKKDNNPMHKND